MTFQVFKKEMKAALRDQKTILLSVVIPIFFTIELIFSMENMMFNDSEEQLSVAIPEHTEEELTLWLEESGQLDLVRSEDPVQLVEDGKAVAALQVSDNFTSVLENQGSPVIQVLGDPSSSKGSKAFETIETVLNVKNKRSPKYDLQNITLI